MKNKNLSWVGALFVFALLLWCTAVTPGKVADPATYTCAVYSTFFSLLPRFLPKKHWGLAASQC